MALLTRIVRRDKQRIADKALERNKDKPIGLVFDHSFSWDEMLDAAADVYLGVSSATMANVHHADHTAVHFLDRSHILGSRGMVLSSMAYGHLWI